MSNKLKIDELDIRILDYIENHFIRYDDLIMKYGIIDLERILGKSYYDIEDRILRLAKLGYFSADRVIVKPIEKNVT